MGAWARPSHSIGRLISGPARRLSVLSRIQSKVGQGQLPGRELGDRAAILVSDAFLISPGFITDVQGFLLLIPPVRYVVYRMTHGLWHLTAGAAVV